MARKPTILLVEHERAIAEALAGAVRSNGARAIEAFDVQEATLIVLAGGFLFDLVFAEVEFSTAYDGLDFLRWVRDRQPGAKVVVSSRDASNPEARQHLGPGDTLISKPYDIGSLAVTLADLAKREVRGASRHRRL